MKNKLEEQMNRLMDEASLQELLPGFDQEALWQELATALPAQQPKKKIFATGWVVRAAAILLVGIAVWTGIYFSGSSHSVPTENVAGRSLAAPVKMPKGAAVTATETPPLITRATGAIVPPALQGRPAKSVTPEASIPQAVPDVPVPVSDIEGQANAPAIAKKVTHYLDIEEDSPAVIAPEHVASAPFIQVRLIRPGQPAQSIQQKPLKELALALAR